MYSKIRALGEFTAGKYPAAITGEQIVNHEFKFTAGTFICSEAMFDGELAAASATLTLSAEYNECETSSGKPATVKMTSCDYLLHAGETVAAGVDGTLDVNCAMAGDGIDIEQPESGCVVQIVAQEGLKTLTYTNHEVAKDFDVDINLVEMKYKQNANCPGGAGNKANGAYSGKSTMTGEAEGAETSLKVD
jgi:hypothetical protein